MIVIIDSGGANIASVKFALERLGVESVLSSDADVIQNAERVILPGVGAAGAAMQKLNDYGLVDCIRNLKQPVLGICLGMQLLFSKSDEGDVDLLDIIDGRVSHFDKAQCDVVPHMGWNTVSFKNDHSITKGLPDGSYFYFVHSYRADVSDSTIGETDYGTPFSAIVAQDNFIGCQFHPERSGEVGAQLLKNFIERPL